MKSLLSHAYVAESDGNRQQVLSIFVACHNLTAPEFDEALVEALIVVQAIDIVHIVGYPEDVDRVRGWLREADSVPLQRLENVIGQNNEALRFISFDTTHGEYVATTLGVQEIVGAAFITVDRQQTLLAAFRNGGGEQRAPVGTHYAKTSESHADRFLRVSNVLEEGANVRLVAFWLIRDLWKVELKYIVVDTSGIYSLASTAMHEASVRGGLLGQPLLWSHRSHEGVSEIARHHAAEALFLISASTSGGLARRLLAQGANPDRLVTLFSLAGEPGGAGRMLCDLRGPEGGGISPIRNHAQRDCPMCAKHYHLIRIQGDQFAIAPPNVSVIEIKASDLPTEYKPLLATLLGLRSFFVYRRREGSRLCTLGMDVEPILSGELTEKNRAILVQKRDEWISLVRRSSTVSLRHVVAGAYKRSGEIAEAIANDVRTILRDAERPTVMTPEQLRSAVPGPGTSTIVVSACIDDAKELLSVSRTLRDVQENGSTTYLAVATLIAVKAETDRLRSNLTFGQHGSGTFSLHSLIRLPLECYEEEPSWAAELRELQRLQTWADRVDRDVPPEMERRIQRLQEAPASGLVDDLFWPAAEGNVLALRSDFTLVSDARRTPEATQADLFAVMSLVLSQLRHSSDPSRRLSHNAYERAVLSPDNFDRFNDGVLQACLLRAAHPKELAYGACDTEVSEQMLTILLHALPGLGVPERSEALMEFMIALLTRRMTLCAEHVLDFCERVATAGAADANIVLIAAYLAQREDIQTEAPVELVV
jgi:hypothetical protein